MKILDKYQKMIIGMVIVAVSITLIYVFVLFGGFRSNNSSSDDSGVPFFIIFSSWPAIWVPIIALKRQEAKVKEEELVNQMED